MKLDAHETKYFTTSWDKTLKSWDLTTGTLLWRGCHDGILTNGDVSADSKMFLTVSDMDRRVKIWATSTGQVLQDIKDLHQGTIMSCRWMQSGEKFLTGSMDGQVKVWDMRSCKTTLTLAAHKAAVSCIDSTSDDMIATGSWDK
jgi:WD40 repeat protein